MEFAPAPILCKQASICNFTSTQTAVEEGRAICANMKQFIRCLIRSRIGRSACIFLAAALGLSEAHNPLDLDIMDKPPREADKILITPGLSLRYMTIGGYNCATTVGAFSYWFLFDPTGPQMSHY